MSFVLTPSLSSCTVRPSVAGWSSWQLVGLITRRSQVRVLSPQPRIIKAAVQTNSGFFICFFCGAGFLSPHITDSMQYKNANYAAFSNWNLSSNRAMSVENILQLATCNLQVVGMTDRAPYDVKNPQAASNRRIELLVLTGRPSSRKG